MATTATSHLVIPGQVIATSSTNPEAENNSNHDEGFLRGHGTFVEHDAAVILRHIPELLHPLARVRGILIVAVAQPLLDDPHLVLPGRPDCNGTRALRA